MAGALVETGEPERLKRFSKDTGKASVLMKSPV
jgi:hypothetical protein